MRITITIPDALADLIDQEAKRLMGKQEMQPDGSVIARPLFPGGIKDWVQEAVCQNIQGLAERNPGRFPIIKTVQTEQQQKQKEWKDSLRQAFEPEVQVSSSGPSR